MVGIAGAAATADAPKAPAANASPAFLRLVSVLSFHASLLADS